MSHGDELDATNKISHPWFAMLLAVRSGRTHEKHRALLAEQQSQPVDLMHEAAKRQVPKAAARTRSLVRENRGKIGSIVAILVLILARRLYRRNKS